MDTIKNSMEENVKIEDFSYADEFTITRMLLYGLTSTRNKYAVDIKEFENACSRYGLDCPFPFIRSRDKKIIFDIKYHEEYKTEDLFQTDGKTMSSQNR